MKNTSYKVAAIISLSLSAVASDANAQDGYGYGADNDAQVQYAPNDNVYAVPPAYQGQYYPQEYQGATGYHGTTNTSDNTAAGAHGEDPYYYYYY